MSNSDYQKDQLESIQLILDGLVASKENLVAEAQTLVHQYWHWFNNENTNISRLRKVGMTELDVSNIAPVIEKKPSREIVAYYIIWKKHPSRFRKNMKKGDSKKKGASIPMHSYSSRTISDVLKNKCTWDKSRALDYEKKFEASRVAIKATHEAEILVRAARRKLINLNTVTQTGEHND
jgi:hypothetical protein